MTPEQQKVSFEAVAVAQSAIAQCLDCEAVARLSAMAQTCLANTDDPLRRANGYFVKRHAMGQTADNCMIQQGRALRDAVLESADTRTSVWRDRADVR